MSVKVGWKLIICSSIILFSIITYEVFVDEMKKIPADYDTISEHEGQDRVLGTIGGEISEPFWIRETLREKVVSVNGNILEITSHVIGVDSATNQVIFDNTQTFFVDRSSRKHHNMDEYFTFPPNVQKMNYEFFYPMMFTKTTFVFDKVKTINDLEVYDFTCRYSAVDVSSSFPQFPSSKIYSDGTCAISVEPVTGMVVSFSKEWDDYFVNDGVRGAQVEIGGKHTTEYSKSILVDNAKSTKSLYYFLDVILPSMMIAIGIIALFVIVLFEKTKNQARVIMETQNELIKKERLSAIGEITARISHDLRNPLSLIKLATDGMQLRLDKKLDPKLDEYIPLVSDAILRITHQINQVLRFVKTMPLDIRLISISNVLNDAIRYVQIPENVSVKLPENDNTLMADKIQLAIAFSNILSNAVDAIGEKKGTITIRTRVENENLVIEFEDSGSGIKKDNIDKMFQPLFTTKPHGTGLGLSSVRDIVTAHGGSVSVTSPPTIFTITLPQNAGSK
ncbi:porin PorA family protein [Candidatus Nitrosotenuis cloacae]|uniref:porin PorA family protein n=1 Tax=Candidatus Nitrosotenuis cloacae TaxID=1603555 RepID=UPI0022825334|nr:porin PorA family protein [Candidatus Nitrosotenuis cloacae]